MWAFIFPGAPGWAELLILIVPGLFCLSFIGLIVFLVVKLVGSQDRVVQVCPHCGTRIRGSPVSRCPTCGNIF